MASAGDGIVMVAYPHSPWDPRVRREAETLVRRGHAVTVVCNREPDRPTAESIGGVSVVRVPIEIRRGGPLRYLYQYLVFFLLATVAVRRLRPQCMHVHSVPDFLAFVALGPKLRGIPVTLDLHEALPELILARFPSSRLAVRLARAAERLSAGFADRLIVVNDTIRDLVASRGVSLDRITVVYNSPDALAGSVTPSDPLHPIAVLRLVYAGSVDRERDLETLIRAVAVLRTTTSTALAIYGRAEPRYRAYLDGLLDGLGLGETVRFGGELSADRVLSHLMQSDVGVVTYARNPLTEVALPNKVFEYVLLDKPLVLPDLRAMRHAFAEAAWFYRPGDPEDLAAKIREATRSGGASQSRRERARAVYHATRWEVQAALLAALYEKAAASADGRAGWSS